MNIVDSLMAVTLLGSEWVLWMLIILSIVSVAIMFERGLFFSRMGVNFGDFSQRLTDALLSDNIDQAKKICEESPSLECQVALRGLDYRSKGAKAMDESMSSFIAGQRQNLDKGLVVLGTLGNNAPFIGLFGTVIGIIKAFHDLASNPAGGPSVVMAGISEALIATAVGLMVAIPAVIAYNWFQRIVRKKLANAEAIKNLVTAHHA